MLARWRLTVASERPRGAAASRLFFARATAPKTSTCRSVRPKGLASCSRSPMPHTRYYTFRAMVELIHRSAWKGYSQKLSKLAAAWQMPSLCRGGRFFAYDGFVFHVLMQDFLPGGCDASLAV